MKDKTPNTTHEKAAPDLSDPFSILNEISRYSRIIDPFDRLASEARLFAFTGLSMGASAAIAILPTEGRSYSYNAAVSLYAALFFFTLFPDKTKPLLRDVKKPLAEKDKKAIGKIAKDVDELCTAAGVNKVFFDETAAERLEKVFKEYTAAHAPQAQIIAPPRNPDFHTMLNDAVTNKMQAADAIGAGAFDLVVSNKTGKRPEISAYTLLNYDDDANIAKYGTRLTEYERQVSDAITTLYIDAEKAGEAPIFTIDTIFRAMPGGSDKAQPQQRNRIKNAIEKLSTLNVEIDATEQLRKYGIIGQDEKRVYKSHFLQITAVEAITKNAVPVNAYRIDAKPILYDYAAQVKQLLTIPAKYLSFEKMKHGAPSGETVKLTEERSSIANYLLRRILIIKNDARQSRTISFNTVFTTAGITTTDRHQIADYKRFCMERLDEWKAKGLIKGYTVKKSGRATTGAIIDL